jgi:hypothetical protein
MMGDGTPSMRGLYTCSFDRETGKCDTPELISDMWNRDGRYHHDMKLMNVQLDDLRSSIYARTFDTHRNSWEILRSPLNGVDFQSYFRTYPKFDLNDCGFKCCGDTGHTYVEVVPKTYVADGDDIFVAWNGFYQDCSDIYRKGKPLMWTLGISKLKKDAECVLTGGDEDVHFDTCSEPVSIVYQNSTGRSRVLPYGGFTIARSLTGRRMFFLSVLVSEGIDEGRLTSEVWISPEASRYSRSPGELQTIGTVLVKRAFFDQAVEDAGTIRLHLNKDGQPDHLCRTIFDAGVSCFPISMEEDGKVHASEPAFEFVSPEQVQETCSLSVFRNKPIMSVVSTVTTGLEVQWSSDGSPEKVIFACYGDASSFGNFTTADRDGNVVQTLHGAYPGSILFGTELSHQQQPQPQLDTYETKSENKGSSYLPSITVLSVVLVLALLHAYRRVSGKRMVRVRGDRVYAIDGRTSADGDDQDHVTFSQSVSNTAGAPFRTSYFELSTLERNYTETEVMSARAFWQP